MSIKSWWPSHQEILVRVCLVWHQELFVSNRSWCLSVSIYLFPCYNLWNILYYSPSSGLILWVHAIYSLCCTLHTVIVCTLYVYVLQLLYAHCYVYVLQLLYVQSFIQVNLAKLQIPDSFWKVCDPCYNYETILHQHRTEFSQYNLLYNPVVLYTMNSHNTTRCV